MFQVSWSDKPTAVCAPELQKRGFDRVNISYWCEHCVECSQPACYKSCENYLARKDGRCRLTEYGMRPEPDGGVRLKFRKWGKLETKRFLYAVSAQEAGRIEKRYVRLAKTAARFSRAFGRIDKIGLFENGLYALWNRLLLSLHKGEKNDADSLYIDCESHMAAPFKLIVETVLPGGRVAERRSVDIAPGKNEAVVPLDLAALNANWTSVVRLYPENDAEAEITLHALQLVRMRAQSAKTVKCVAWDLDGTLWDGVLTETEERLSLRKGIAELIRAFDEKGVLQTVVSKNDHDPAMRELKRLGVAQYFLYPAINWGQKSESIRRIAESLNIHVNSFLFVDDSAFERGEVLEHVPGIRVADENGIFALAKGPLFNLPVTDESRARRKMYMTEMARNEIRAGYAGDYDAFLRSCQMEITMLPVEGEKLVTRCFELVQRTNQLNMTGKKYDRDAFRRILSDPGRVNAAFQCRDRFGDYGVVGFLSAERNGDALSLRELTVSCRVAKKFVEDAVVAWLIARYGEGTSALTADYVKTPRNTPMRETLEEIGLKPDGDAGMSMRTADFRLHDVGIKTADWEDET